jgi:hypothetical protein
MASLLIVCGAIPASAVGFSAWSLQTTTSQSQQGNPSVNSSTPYVTAGAAVLGALLGGAFTLLSGHLVWKRQREVDEERWMRENQTRFHEARRELYAKFLGSLAEILPKAKAISTRREKASAAGKQWPASDSDRERLEELVNKEQELLGLRWEISVIGSKSVGEAVGDLDKIQLRAYNAAVADQSENWTELNRQFELAGVLFVTATRRELGEPL